MDPDFYLLNPPDEWAIDADDLTDDEINDRLADLEDRDPYAFNRLTLRILQSGLI